MISTHTTNKVKEKKRGEGAKSRVQVLLPDSRHALIWHLASFATSSVDVGGSGSSRRGGKWSSKVCLGKSRSRCVSVEGESKQQNKSNLFHKQSPSYIMIIPYPEGVVK